MIDFMAVMMGLGLSFYILLGCVEPFTFCACLAGQNSVIWGFPNIRGTLLGGPILSILGSIFSFPKSAVTYII